MTNKDSKDIETNLKTLLSLDSKIKTEKYGIITLSELLLYKLDLCSSPKKASIAALASCCTDVMEGNTMKWLCSKANEGKVLWQHYIEEQRMGIAELLYHFPSCKPSLNSLAAILSPASPRYYSIASSPLLNETSVAVAFSLVRYTCGMIADDGSNTIISKVDREGVCTSYLEGALQYWLGNPEQKSSSNPDVFIPMFHKPATLGFQLPGSVDAPLILIGPGTGVAPFIGFLEHRSQLERSRVGNTNTACTGCWRGSFEIEDAKGDSFLINKILNKKSTIDKDVNADVESQLKAAKVINEETIETGKKDITFTDTVKKKRKPPEAYETEFSKLITNAKFDSVNNIYGCIWM